MEAQILPITAGVSMPDARRGNGIASSTAIQGKLDELIELHKLQLRVRLFELCPNKQDSKRDELIRQIEIAAVPPKVEICKCKKRLKRAVRREARKNRAKIIDSYMDAIVELKFIDRLKLAWRIILKKL